jgi:hypothetical protein
MIYEIEHSYINTHILLNTYPIIMKFPPKYSLHSILQFSINLRTQIPVPLPAAPSPGDPLRGTRDAQKPPGDGGRRAQRARLRLW